jgi:hypothetical protein
VFWSIGVRPEEGPLGADERAAPPHGSGAGTTGYCAYNGEACPAYLIWRDTSFVISNMET